MSRRLSGERSRPSSRGSDGLTLSRTNSNKDGRQSPVADVAFENTQKTERKVSSSSNEQPAPKKGLTIAKRGSRVMAAVAALNSKAKESTGQSTFEPKLDPKEVDTAFEAVLDSRNVPENMRAKMRSLTLHVKADFVKQDREAATPVTPSRTSTWPSDPSENAEVAAEDSDAKQTEESKESSKRPRPRSRAFTFSKGDRSDKADSPIKKKKADSRPTSIHVEKSGSSNALAGALGSLGRKGPKPAFPEDFVDYLRKVQDPTVVEVGRLHKLRLLLRNETVAWVDSFISLGGMTEIVALLHRIMAVEWREEHEDQLLHETLLCLKGLSTTEVALKKLDGVADTLFPALLSMLFSSGEERKGPSEFSTRTVIINVLCKYLIPLNFQLPTPNPQPPTSTHHTTATALLTRNEPQSPTSAPHPRTQPS